MKILSKLIKKIFFSLFSKKYTINFIRWISEYQGKWISFTMIKLFIYIYKINMKEVKEKNIKSYINFNDFFSRSLQEKARPIDMNPNILVMPSDGVVTQFGITKMYNSFQIKERQFNLQKLLVNNNRLFNTFYNGQHIIIYLSPKDYHRVHMPCDGILQEMFYVPGKLFSVNPYSRNKISNLLSKNERVMCLFQTNFGPILQILVGSIIVGSIETTWSGCIIPPRKNTIKHWFYPKGNDSKNIFLKKGQEMGKFKLGSTVIILFTKQSVLLGDHIHKFYVTKVGQKLAKGIIHKNTIKLN